MIVAWTFMCDALEIETEGDLILPRYETAELARQMAQEEAQRTGKSQMLCKVVISEWHHRKAE